MHRHQEAAEGGLYVEGRYKGKCHGHELPPQEREWYVTGVHQGTTQQDLYVACPQQQEDFAKPFDEVGTLHPP